jgi:bacterioferritin-associated ferredoxin
MLVCSCLAVFESTVRNTIAAGASCVDSVGERCGAGRDCGTCIEHIEELLEEFDNALDQAIDRSTAA